MLYSLKKQLEGVGATFEYFFFFLFLKVWWQDVTLFCFFFIFYNMHTFIQSHSYNTFIHRHSLRPLSILIACLLSGETPPCGAEPWIELGPALQQADALPTEPSRATFEYFPYVIWEEIFPNIFLYAQSLPKFLLNIRFFLISKIFNFVTAEDSHIGECCQKCRTFLVVLTSCIF